MVFHTCTLLPHDACRVVDTHRYAPHYDSDGPAHAYRPHQVLYEQLDQELAYFGITLLELADQGKQLAWLETGTTWNNKAYQAGTNCVVPCSVGATPHGCHITPSNTLQHTPHTPSTHFIVY